MENFSSRLAAVRKERKITKQALADMLGVTVRVVQYYEKGERTPPLDTLVKIAGYLDVSLDYLVGLSDVQKPR